MRSERGEHDQALPHLERAVASAPEDALVVEALSETLSHLGDYPALVDALGRIGWEIPKPRGTMFVWAPIPEPYAEMDSVEFCSTVVRDADVALSPGVGFGPGGEGFVRFALIENEKRIQQAVRNLRRGLPKLG